MILTPSQAALLRAVADGPLEVANVSLRTARQLERLGLVYVSARDRRGRHFATLAPAGSEMLAQPS